MLTVSLNGGLCGYLGQRDQALHILGIRVLMVDRTKGLISRGLALGDHLRSLHERLLMDLRLLLALHILQDVVVVLDLLSELFVELDEVLALIGSALRPKHLVTGSLQDAC